MSTRTHGMWNTPEYHAWQNAKDRCLNPAAREFARYGARGINVAPEWQHDFPAFYAHIGPRPDPTYSLDRIDNERGYEPGNVRWATHREQQNNMRANLAPVTYDGRTQPISAWAAEVGLKHTTLIMRINKGWTVERSLTTPTLTQKKVPSCA